MLTLILLRAALASSCLEGRVQVGQDPGACCWQGQSWTAEAGCAGLPTQCPSGMRPSVTGEPEGCVLDAVAPSDDQAPGWRLYPGVGGLVGGSGAPPPATAPATKTDLGPGLALGEVVSLGSLTVDQLRAGYVEQASKLQHCVPPQRTGTVVLKVVIEVDGRVRSVSVKGGDLADDSTARCLVDAVGALSYPAPGDAIVIASVVFALGGSSP